MKNTFLFISTLFLSMIVGIFLIEGFFILRSDDQVNWHDPNTQFDAHLGWKPIANRSIVVPEWGRVSSNSDGFRSEEIDPNKDQVVIFGDSVAWGYGVGDKETASYFLEQDLKQKNIQVLNLGVSGYGLDQAYLYLEKNILKFKNLKSVILIVCAGTDYEDIQYNNAYEKKKPYFYLKNGNLVLDQKRIFKYNFMNLYSISSFIKKISQIHPKIKLFLLNLRGEKRSADEDMPYIVASLLSKMDVLVKKHNANLKVVLVPEADEIRGEEGYYPWFQKILNSQGFDTLDFRKVLQLIPSSEDLYIDPYHYNREGNILLTKAIKTRWFS